MSYDTATPYIACCIILKRANKALFVLRDNTGWMDGNYGLIGGKVEKNETYSEGAIREAKEEAGVDIKPKDLDHRLTIHRKGNDGSMWVDVVFEAAKWTGEPYNAEPKVHNKIEWLDINNLPNNMIPMIDFVFEQIAADNNYAEFGWN